MVYSVVFDLDGTLVDSSDGILASMSSALMESGFGSIDLDSTHIGPPLPSVFQTLLPTMDLDQINQLCLLFKCHYDTSGYLLTKPYHGVVKTLDCLRDLKYRLFIVTNKRAAPTRKILNLLGLDCYFEFVYSLDMCKSSHADKSCALSNLLLEFNLNATVTPYIGDRLADFFAATSVSMPFALAQWGYASQTEFSGVSKYFPLLSPSTILFPSFLDLCS